MMRMLQAGLAVILLAAGSVLPAAADEASDVAAIASAMSALDEAFQNQDATAIRSMTTPDHVAVTIYYVGPQTVDQQIASLPDLDIEFYDAIPPKIALLSADAALATFEHSYRGTFRGNPVPQRVFVSEVWVRIDGKWLQKFYQETVMEEE